MGGVPLITCVATMSVIAVRPTVRVIKREPVALYLPATSARHESSAQKRLNERKAEDEQTKRPSLSVRIANRLMERSPRVRMAASQS